MINLHNKLRTMQTFNLPHEVYCAGRPCQCNTQNVALTEVAKDGTKGVREFDKKVSQSLRLLGGEIRRDLPDQVRLCPEVKAALDRGDVRVVE